MLTLLGFGMVLTFMALIMTRRLSPLVALTLVPILFACIGGFGGQGIGAMMLDGIKNLAPTGVMLLFAILYFGIMIDAGLFDPLVRLILRAARNSPTRIVVGTTLLAAFVSLDGDGSTTYMITVAAMLPLYRRIGLDPLILTCVTILAGGVMNLTPWGGPLARAASALHVDPAEIFVPMIPTMAVGVVSVLLLSYVLGKREAARLGAIYLAMPQPEPENHEGFEVQECGEQKGLKRPKLIVLNAVLTIGLLVALIMGALPLSVLFMIAFAIAILCNYPNVQQQRERIAEHSKNALAVVSLIFAAGIFTGILSGTGMVDAMANSLLAIVPESCGPFLAPILAIASMPFTFFISNDAFYYGVVPVVTHAAEAYGISPVEMARASLVGQPVHLLSPLVPSTYLLVGLAGVEFGDHQRYTLKWAIGVSLVLMFSGLLFGLFPLAA